MKCEGEKETLLIKQPSAASSFKEDPQVSNARVEGVNMTLPRYSGEITLQGARVEFVGVVY